ncbi:MAG: sel1 repeat family protein [Candidatus Saccharibacteria bacterium]|nr:sel1 repeat family protein [Rhodoferax sp.]
MNDTIPTIISLDTVCAITEISKSTLRRRIAKGNFTRLTDDARGRAILLWSEVEPHICIPIEPEDEQFILLADAGDAEAQDAIGQLFLMSEKYQAALYWFQQAAQQNNPDAMQWLGHCYINGKGVAKDEHLGVMWIAKAAAQGHVIAQGLMKELINHTLDNSPKSPT